MPELPEVETVKRVLEKIVITKYINKNDKNDNADFKDKIKNVIDEFDEDIRDILKNTYGLLSKGIHELDENECLKHFDTLKEIVEILLDQKLDLLKKKKKIDSLKRNLNKISSEL